MRFQSLLLTHLCTLAAASAFAHPEAVDEHELYIRNPEAALADLTVDTHRSVIYHSKSARAARNPPSERHHKLRIRASPKSDKSAAKVTSKKPVTSQVTYNRKSTLDPRSPADKHVPLRSRYTPASCIEPECENICICYQRPGDKEPRVVSYPWVAPDIVCIDFCLYDTCSCSPHRTP